MFDLLDLIQKEKELKYFDAQLKLDWGDGIMERVKRDTLTYFSDEIKFNSKKRIFYAIDMKVKNLALKN